MKNKKLIISLIMILTLLFPGTIYAKEEDDNTIEYLEDGSYFVVEIIESNGLARSSKSATKSVIYYDAVGTAQWKFSLTGTFSYNNSTSSATNSSATVTIYDSSWWTSSKNATYSGSTAKGSVGVSKSILGVTSTISKDLSISCDKAGNIS